MRLRNLPADLVASVRRGVVIPAHPLALDKRRRLDERRQRALTRYYVDAGAGGVAVGVHTTQFEIRDPKVGLYEPILALAADAIDARRLKRPFLKVAGICGRTPQAVREAETAVSLGYHAGLLSLAAFRDDRVPAMLRHCAEVAKAMPLFGFYLQPAVGGRVLPYAFWRRFAEIENVLAIKIAPFSRYQTLEVLRAVCDAGREKEIALYTGNDDHLVLDLLAEHRFRTPSGKARSVRIAGGLLGHWSVWTRKAVEMMEMIRKVRETGKPVPASLLRLAEEVTDANAALFDAANNFAGCIPGLHAVLAGQGLMASTLCLDPKVRLSPGQAEEIARVRRAYPHLLDDAFVAERLDGWLAD